MANPLGRLGVCASDPCGAPPGDCDAYCEPDTAVQCYRVVISGSSTVDADGVSINGSYLVEAWTQADCTWIGDQWCDAEDSNGKPQCFRLWFALGDFSEWVPLWDILPWLSQLSINYTGAVLGIDANPAFPFMESEPIAEARDCGEAIALVETGDGGGTAVITPWETSCDAYWKYPCISIAPDGIFCAGCQPTTLMITVDFLSEDYAAYNGEYELALVAGITSWGKNVLYEYEGEINGQQVVLKLYLASSDTADIYACHYIGAPPTHEILWSAYGCFVGNACMSWDHYPIGAVVRHYHFDPSSCETEYGLVVYHLCTAYLTSGEECVQDECPPWKPGDDPECACATDPEKAVFDPDDPPPCCVYGVITNTTATLHSGAGLNNRVLRARITGSSSACLYGNEYGCESPVPEENPCDCFTFMVSFVRGGFGCDPDEVRITAELRYLGDENDSGLIMRFSDIRDYPVVCGETGIVLLDENMSGAQIALTRGAETWDKCEQSSYILDSMRMDRPLFQELGCLPLTLLLTCVYDTPCNALTILAGEYEMTHISGCDREDYEAVFGAVSDWKWFETLRFGCEYYYFAEEWTAKYILGGHAGGMFIEFFDNANPETACYSFILEYAQNENPRFACDHSVKGKTFDLYQIIATGGCAPASLDAPPPYRRLRTVYPDD